MTAQTTIKIPEVQEYDSPVYLNDQAESRILLVCEHASNYIPEQFNGLGLSAENQLSHAAWDPGAFAVANAMSQQLDAELIACSVSRLLYDCNRPPDATDAMPTNNAAFEIPGNADLDSDARDQRIHNFYNPFYDLLSKTISAAPNKPVLVTIHSFTPVYMGQRREIDLGILHDSDSRLADQMLKLANNHTPLRVVRNQPYSAKDGVTHTLKEHGITNGLLNVMLEIRNDLIVTEQQQKELANMLAQLLKSSLSAIGDEQTIREAECPA